MYGVDFCDSLRTKVKVCLGPGAITSQMVLSFSYPLKRLKEGEEMLVY